MPASRCAAGASLAAGLTAISRWKRNAKRNQPAITAQLEFKREFLIGKRRSLRIASFSVSQYRSSWPPASIWLPATGAARTAGCRHGGSNVLPAEYPHEPRRKSPWIGHRHDGHECALSVPACIRQQKVAPRLQYRKLLRPSAPAYRHLLRQGIA